MSKQKELFEMSKVEEKPIKKNAVFVRKATDVLPDYFAPLERINFSDAIPLGRYASTQYLQYAIATVKDRALPRLADGQKPVQSRILYAMWEMNATAGNPRKKSARVVGDVLGKFHPHGDSSVYDALVRIAQNFTLRYPLVDGEGNFGSRDGDDAAAMRYTEARLTKFSEVLLSELNEGTVDFIPNYDGSVNEPCLLPARLPVLLLNGASGIAVGMATEVPSHNLGEVASAVVSLIKKPDMTIKQVMRHIKGPDFPGGAQIITSASDIAEVYATGRGAVRVRARWVVEKLARGQWQLVVAELPPGVSSRKIQEEIDAITNPQPRAGKKSISVTQQKEKQAMLGLWEKPKEDIDIRHYAFECDPDWIENESVKYLESQNINHWNFLNDDTKGPMVFVWMPAISIYFNDPDGHELEFIGVLSGKPKSDKEKRVVTFIEWLKIKNE